jgi:hypothetical protein
MALYAIADTHLSFGTPNKKMNVFKGWENHAERLRTEWNRVVNDDDTVVIGGDISWGLAESLPDFEFIANELNGGKIILKGNHDYWWTSLTKMYGVLSANNINGIDFLHNNAYKVGGLTVCGTKGRIRENDEKFDEKILLREAGRLESSIAAGLESGNEILVFLHYPPICAREENTHILEILEKYSIKRVFSGHIHSSGMAQAFIGEKYGIYFDIVTADSLNFTPRKILETMI